MKKISKSFVKKYLPKRSKLSSKIESGKVLIIAGAKGFYGAGILSALAATRCGVGYTHLMTDLSEFPWLKFPDFIVHPISLGELKKCQECVIAMGPGMGVSKKKRDLLGYLIKNKIPQVVLDADALTLLSQIKSVKLPATWILTPHEGELARLLNVSSREVKKDRLKHAQLAHLKYGCHILLKGADTLVVTSQDVFQVSTGTSALAKAGSGDVLLGMIAAFYAQTQNAEQAAILGAYIHGIASQEWLKEKKDYLSMRPLDLIDQLPKTLFKLRR